MEGKRALLWDVLDFDGACSEADLEGAAARHALAFTRAWHTLFGCVPSGTVHNRYCEGKLPASGVLNTEKFLKFVSGVMCMPIASNKQQQQQLDASLASYQKSLQEDPAALRREIVVKLCDRYGGGPPERYEHTPLQRVHSTLRANADMNEIDSHRNPVTGHHVGEETAPFVPCRREAWRSVTSRDMLFASRASHGRCVFVDSSAAAHVASAAAIASEAADGCQVPITVMSDCSRVLRAVTESLDFYHYAYHVPCAEAYMAMPRLFQSFVLVGGSGHRPPLCRSKERCWHYLLDRRTTTNGEEQGYVVVADTFETCLAAQSAVQRLTYLVPPILSPGRAVASEGRLRIGFHPDTIDHVKSVKNPVAVPPEESHRCEIYVSCVSEEGVERCMASGGVAVAKSFRLVDDGVNGFLCGEGTSSAINSAVLRAIACSAKHVGEEAAKVRVLFGEPTFRWLWKGLLGRSDPLITGNARDAQCLHERFLIISVSLRYREAIRYRCTTSQRRAVVFMDNRPDAGTALSLLVTLTNLRAGWGVVGFVTRESRPYFEDVLGHLGADAILVDMQDYKKKSFFIEQYNARFKSVDTWLTVAEHADMCLTVQNDGLLVRQGLESHQSMAYDYCGAPWKTHPYLHKETRGNLVGNGGFSLRSVPEMVRVCRLHYDEARAVYPMAPMMSQAEDVFFASRVSNVCPFEHASGFAMEQNPSPDALGYHRFWAYHPVDFTVKYFERLLQQTAASVPSTKEPSVQPSQSTLKERQRQYLENAGTRAKQEAEDFYETTQRLMREMQDTEKKIKSELEEDYQKLTESLDVVDKAYAAQATLLRKLRECESKMEELTGEASAVASGDANMGFGVGYGSTSANGDDEIKTNIADTADDDDVFDDDVFDDANDADANDADANDEAVALVETETEEKRDPSENEVTEQSGYVDSVDRQDNQAQDQEYELYDGQYEQGYRDNLDDDQYVKNDDLATTTQTSEEEQQQQQPYVQQQQQPYVQQQQQQQQTYSQYGGERWYKNQRASGFEIVGYGPIVSGLAVTLLAALFHP